MGQSGAESNGRSHNTETLYREHGAAVASLCRALLRDRGEAEDATQQVFLSAHRALLNGSAPREPLAWLLAVARHECYTRHRRRAASPVPAEDVPEGATPDASLQVLRAGELASMWEEVGRMPAAQREAFLLREIRGLSYRQLAAELSLSPPSVRSLLLRARTRLRQKLGGVAAGVGGAPWLQGLFRLVAGGDGGSPLPAATKAAAVGIGALALVGGGDLGRVARHAEAPGTPRQATGRHGAQPPVRRAASPAAVAVVPRGDRSSFDGRRSGGREDGPPESGPESSGSREGRDAPSTSSGDSSLGSGSEASGDTIVVTPTTTDGHDGGSSSPSGSSGDGSGSGSDGGSGSATTTTSSGSGGADGSDSSVGPDSGSSDGG